MSVSWTRLAPFEKGNILQSYAYAQWILDASVRSLRGSVK